MWTNYTNNQTQLVSLGRPPGVNQLTTCYQWTRSTCGAYKVDLHTDCKVSGSVSLAAALVNSWWWQIKVNVSQHWVAVKYWTVESSTLVAAVGSTLSLALGRLNWLNGQHQSIQFGWSVGILAISMPGGRSARRVSWGRPSAGRPAK